MAQTLVESDLFRSYWDEGVLDLLCGLAVLVTGLGWALGLGALAVIQAPLWIILWPPLRRQIVEPRAGYVQFSLERRRQNARGLWWALALGVGALILVPAIGLLFVPAGASPGIGRAVAGLPSALVGLAAVIAGALTGAGRFQGYAMVLAAAAAVTVLLALDPGIPLAAGGLIVTLAGALLLTRFIRASRAYPAEP